MNRDRIALRKQLLFVHAFGACGLRLFGSEILAPGKNAHAERLAISRHIGSDPSETDDPKNPSFEIDAWRNAFLETSRADRRIACRNFAGRRQQQCETHLRRRCRRMAARRKCADDAPFCAGFLIYARRARPRQGQHLQSR